MHSLICDIKMDVKSVVSAMLLLITAGGCTNFHETYYVGMYDPTPTTQPSIDGGPAETQLYKYDITGNSFASKTQFAAGLYDAGVVDQLFGEVRPASTQPSPQVSQPSNNPEEEMGTLVADWTFPQLPQGEANSPAFEADDADVSIQAAAPPFRIMLEAVTQIQAKSVTATLDSTKSKLTLSFGGITSVVASNPRVASTQPLQSQISGAVSLFPQSSTTQPITAPSSIQQVNTIPNAVLTITGGSPVIFSSDAATSKGVLLGSFTSAVSATPDGTVGWGVNPGGAANGSYMSQGGKVVSGGGIIQVTGGATTFTGVTNISAASGANVTVVNGSYLFSGMCTVPMIAKSSVSGLVVIEKDDALKIHVGAMTLYAAVGQATADNPAKLPTTISLDHPFPVAPSDPTDLSKAISVNVTNLHTEKLLLDGGAIHLTMSVSQSIDSSQQSAPVKTAPPVDRSRHIFVRFGPEGTAVAQSDSERMVIFMSSDPQALTDRISAMGNAQQTEATISAVIAKPRLDDQAIAIQSAKTDFSSALAASAAFLQQIKSAPVGSDTINLLSQQFVQGLDSGQ